MDHEQICLKQKLWGNLSSSMTITRRQFQNIFPQENFLLVLSSLSKAKEITSDVPLSDDEGCWNHINSIGWRQVSAVHTLVTTSSDAPDYASVCLAPVRSWVLVVSKAPDHTYPADSRSLIMHQSSLDHQWVEWWLNMFICCWLKAKNLPLSLMLRL